MKRNSWFSVMGVLLLGITVGAAGSAFLIYRFVLGASPPNPSPEEGIVTFGILLLYVPLGGIAGALIGGVVGAALGMLLNRVAPRVAPFVGGSGYVLLAIGLLMFARVAPFFVAPPNSAPTAPMSSATPLPAAPSTATPSAAPSAAPLATTSPVPLLPDAEWAQAQTEVPPLLGQFLPPGATISRLSRRDGGAYSNICLLAPADKTPDDWLAFYRALLPGVAETPAQSGAYFAKVPRPGDGVPVRILVFRFAGGDDAGRTGAMLMTFKRP